MSRELAARLRCELGRLPRLAEHPVASNVLLFVCGLLCVATDLARYTGIPTILAILLLYVKAKQRTARQTDPSIEPGEP